MEDVAMGAQYVHLDLEERRQVARWRDAKMSVPEIALRLGRAPSTIYRELRRNFFRDEELPNLNGYYGLNAQAMAERRRQVQRKLVRFPQVKAAVLDRLKGGWSPEQIAGRMALEQHPVRVSHETIYRYAYSREGQDDALYRHLPQHRRVRRRRGGRRPHALRFGLENSIALRPAAVADRAEFGHWECDLMMFRKEFGTANVTSLVERVSRFTLLSRNPDRQSKPVMEGLIAGLSPLPHQARRSITFDRGTEFSAWLHLQTGLGTQTWFCDPQAPWQKGTVENTNNRLRTWLPRRTDPTLLTQTQLRSISARLNATPRKCLGYWPPHEIFRAKLLEIMRAEG